MPEMSLGDAIRRLDALSKELHEQLTSGPRFLPVERNALARTLTSLLPVIADSFQDDEDNQPARRQGGHTQPWFTETRALHLRHTLEANPTDDASDWAGVDQPQEARPGRGLA